MLIYCTCKNRLIQIEYAWALYYVPVKLDDLSHIVIQHFFLFWCWDPLCGYDCSPQVGTGRQAKAQPYHSQHLYVGFSLDCWGSKPICLACRPGPFTLYILLTSTSVVITVSQTGTASQKSHSNTITHANTLYELNTRLSLRKGTLRWFFKSLWLATHKGHCDLKVSENYPHPTYLAPQKMWCPLVWQTKLTTHWVLHRDNHPTHILHPTCGHASGSPQVGQVPVLLCCSTNQSLIPIPASLSLPFSILLLIHYTWNKPAITPEASVLRCWASACHDYAQPLQQQ